MDIEAIKREKEEIVKKYGRWTAHNIQLAENLYTIDSRVVGDEVKARRILQVVSDNANRPLKELRILDLASHEGLYSIELAQHGATVVGIEGREANLEKAQFAKKVLSLSNLDFFLDDVRNLSQEKYGEFDVVLCLGILYHLDAPDVFIFLERIAEVCRHFTVIDTHISLSPKKLFIYKGQKYWGKNYREHFPFTSLEQRKKALWASLDNPNSFWFTRRSLYNFLSEVGFTSVYECHNPPEPKKPKDRLTLLAIKGQKQKLATNPVANDLMERRYPNER